MYKTFPLFLQAFQLNKAAKVHDTGNTPTVYLKISLYIFITNTRLCLRLEDQHYHSIGLDSPFYSDIKNFYSNTKHFKTMVEGR